jgi:putative (di)nucleoside polyphosphate hydrolase
VIDPDGYRPNVGIVLIEPSQGQVFWARRVGHDGWQFPQGGMNSDETPIEAMYRELREETGLDPDDVEVLSATPGWLKYRLPERFIRYKEKPVCVGQKQVWFLLKLVAEESKFRFDRCDKPEFDGWRWVDFWFPLNNVVSFKRRVYERALHHFLPTARKLATISDRDGSSPLQQSFEFHEADPTV